MDKIPNTSRDGTHTKKFYSHFNELRSFSTLYNQARYFCPLSMRPGASGRMEAGDLRGPNAPIHADALEVDDAMLALGIDVKFAFSFSLRSCIRHRIRLCKS